MWWNKRDTVVTCERCGEPSSLGHVCKGVSRRYFFGLLAAAPLVAYAAPKVSCLVETDLVTAVGAFGASVDKGLYVSYSDILAAQMERIRPQLMDWYETSSRIARTIQSDMGVSIGSVNNYRIPLHRSEK